MTKQEFKQAMLRGHGRCIPAVRQEPEKFRQFVLWACQRNIAYDAQCEGTRSWYVYTMANVYPDTETFINAAADALKKYRPNSGWDLLHLSELLMFFAMDGHKSARLAVEEKYRELLMALHRRKRRPNGLFHELSDLEQLALVLSIDRVTFLGIAGDFGRLYREKPFMQEGDFDWFFASKAERYRKALERAAQKDANLACFLQKELANIEAQEARWQQRRATGKENLTGVRLSLWLAKQKDSETANRYAAVYRKQPDAELRAQALEAFSRCPYPDDPQLIIADTQVSCEQLRIAAWNALENVRHPAVREFALHNAVVGNRTLENFALLVTNYIPRDKELLECLLREWIEAKDWDSVHAAGLELFRAFDKSSGIPHPKHLLPLLYEYNPCSCCRDTALVYLARHRMLTVTILEECLHDSNDEIRQRAKRKLNK